jgi:type IV secretory pathway VirB10-like protein
MNGNTSQATTPPPSVQQARRQAAPKRAWTGLWRTRIVGTLFVLAILAVIGAQIFMRTHTSTPSVTSETTGEPLWGRQTFQYEPEKAAPAPLPLEPVDTIGPALARLRSELAGFRVELGGLRSELNELKNRKTVPPAVGKAGQAPETTRLTPAPTLFVAHDVAKDAAPPKPTRPEYVLAPWATYLPCIVQPKIISDVPGLFTAKISQNVYDTQTGQHLLVPQGATVGGQDKGEVLLYGNERLPTFTLALTIEERVYKLDAMPVTDQLGTNGLTGEVDNHWWRLFGAVFIQGALRGGQQAMQMAMVDAGGAGQVATGIAGAANQVTQQRLGRALDTRPTITVFPGQGCQVLLTKPLALPAVWQ